MSPKALLEPPLEDRPTVLDVVRREAALVLDLPIGGDDDLVLQVPVRPSIPVLDVLDGRDRGLPPVRGDDHALAEAQRVENHWKNQKNQRNQKKQKKKNNNKRKKKKKKSKERKT